MADDTPNHQSDQPENHKDSTPGDPMATPDVAKAVEQELDAMEAMLAGNSPATEAPAAAEAAEPEATEPEVTEAEATEAEATEAEATEAEPDEGEEAIDAAIDAGDVDTPPEPAEAAAAEVQEGSAEVLESDQMLNAMEAAINGTEPSAAEEEAPQERPTDHGATETDSKADAGEPEAGTVDGDALLNALEAAILGEPDASTEDDSADRDDASETPESEFGEDSGQAGGLSEQDLAELDDMIALSVDAETDAPEAERPSSSPASDEPTDGGTGEASDEATEVSVAASAPVPSVVVASADEVGALTRAVWLPAAGLVGACDAIDRVVGRLADPFIKQIIGYVAIGTFALAAILLGGAWLKL